MGPPRFVPPRAREGQLGMGTPAPLTRGERDSVMRFYTDSMTKAGPSRALAAENADAVARARDQGTLGENRTTGGGAPHLRLIPVYSVQARSRERERRAAAVINAGVDASMARVADRAKRRADSIAALRAAVRRDSAQRDTAPLVADSGRATKRPSADD
jgi:hypothetical protein